MGRTPHARTHHCRSSFPVRVSAGQLASPGEGFAEQAVGRSGPQWEGDGPRDLQEEALQEGPKRPKSFFLSLLKDFRVASLTQAFKEVLIKEELKTQLVKLVVTAALNEKKQAAFKKETLLVTDR